MPIAAVKNQAMLRWFNFNVVTLCFDAIEVIMGIGMMALQVIMGATINNIEAIPVVKMDDLELDLGLGVEVIEEVDALEMTDTDTDPDLETEDIDGGVCDD